MVSRKLSQPWTVSDLARVLTNGSRNDACESVSWELDGIRPFRPFSCNYRCLLCGQLHLPTKRSGQSLNVWASIATHNPSRFIARATTSCRSRITSALKPQLHIDILRAIHWDLLDTTINQAFGLLYSSHVFVISTNWTVELGWYCMWFVEVNTHRTAWAAVGFGLDLLGEWMSSLQFLDLQIEPPESSTNPSGNWIHWTNVLYEHFFWEEMVFPWAPNLKPSEKPQRSARTMKSAARARNFSSPRPKGHGEPVGSEVPSRSSHWQATSMYCSCFIQMNSYVWFGRL